MVIQTASRDVSGDFLKALKTEQDLSRDINWVTFPPNSGSNAWLFISDGWPVSLNCPSGCHQKISDIRSADGRAVQAAFTAQHGWAVMDNKGKVSTSSTGIPSGFTQKINELAKANVKVSCIAFMTEGEGWCIVTELGQPFQEGIPWKCVDTLQMMFKNKIIARCVALGPVFDQWITIDSHDVWRTQNEDDELQMWMTYQNQVYGPIQYVAFDPDKHGFVTAALVNKFEKVYDPVNKTHVAPLDVYKNIQDLMYDREVGYACTIGTDNVPGGFTSGFARTAADAPEKKFVLSTKTIIASCSKLITALTAVRVLGTRIDDTIANYLPSDWTGVGPIVKSFKYRELLSHSVGIQNKGAGDDYASCKTFFSLPVSATVPDKNFDMSKRGQWKYSNMDYAIMKILLPIAAGTVKPDVTEDRVYADAFVALAQKYVFDPIGVSGINYKPPESGPQADGFAYMYDWPGTSKGFHYPEGVKEVSSGGFYLTIEEARKLLHSYSNSDGKVIDSNQIGSMINFGGLPLGWDNNELSNGTRWVQKDGGAGTYSATFALFGNGLYGALFLNAAPLNTNKYQPNWQWCNKCQALTFAGAAGGLGPCVTDGKRHDNTGSGSYVVAAFNYVPPGGIQQGWRYCQKCQGLCFITNNPNAPCSGGNSHDFSKSGNYTLKFTVNPTLPNGLVDPLIQTGWRHCKKCEVLAASTGTAPAKTCPAGDQHDFGGSGDYLLDYETGAEGILKSAYYKSIKPGQ